MEQLPEGMLFKWIEVPDTLEREAIHSLPADVAAFRQVGDEWLKHAGTATLRVPSVLAPRQWNLLINPMHPLFPAIKVVEQEPFAFDSRLLSDFPTA